MNKPPFDPSQPFQAVDKPPFDPSQPFQAVDGVQQSSQQPQYATKDMIGDIARPLFEGGGAIAGGILGGPLGPVGAAAGGALGFGAGKAASDLLDRGLGRKPFLQSIPEAMKETGNDALTGAAAEATGQMAGKVAQPILKAVGSAGSTIGEWANGIPKKDYRVLANNPASFLPGNLERAGENFENAMTGAGISKELTPEAVDRMRSPGQYAFDTFNKLKNEGSITPQEALHARQSLDAAYPIPNQKNGSYIRMLDEIRGAFQDVIGNASPELQVASKEYSIAKSAQKFKTIFPQNKNGTPSYIRSAALLGLMKTGSPKAILGFPAFAGAATVGAGTAGSVANKILGEAPLRRSLFGGAADKLFSANPIAQAGRVNDSNQPSGTINNAAPDNNQKDQIEGLSNKSINHAPPKEKAQEFMKQAKSLGASTIEEIRSLARELARKAGYSW